MSADSVYLDSSALVKLVIAEDESAALRAHLRQHGVRVTCALARVEVPRAVQGHGVAVVRRARAILTDLHVVGVDDPLLDLAASLDGLHLRSLDAIHVAAALAVGRNLDHLVTYDHRMADHAGALGLTVTAPR
jgi:predicted nucleic acid-binding protein